MIEPQSDALSPAGASRRDAMLDGLVAAMRHTRRLRRVRRVVTSTAGGTGLVFLLIALASPSFVGPKPAPQSGERVVADSGQPPPIVEHPSRGCVTRIVRTNVPRDRFRAEPTSRVLRMDDRVLMETLTAIHRPTGLIRFGDRVRLTAAVTDAELGFRR